MSAVEHRVVLIRPSRGWDTGWLSELWSYRELVYFLVWRDVKTRSKQTLLGWLWVMLPPLLTTLLFTFIMGYLAKVPSGGIPYPLLALSGLVPWNFFMAGVSRGVSSVVGNASILTKVYFPRLALPVAGVVVTALDQLVVLPLLAAGMLYYGIAPGAEIAALPLVLLLALTLTLGAVVWMAAVNVIYRDASSLLPFAMQVMMYLTPVVYPLELIPERFRPVYILNPMVGVVEGLRWSLFGGEAPVAAMLVSAAFGVVLLVTGVLFFKRVERVFSDVV